MALAGRSCMRRASALAHIVWCRPHTLVLIPVVVLGLLLGFGVWAVCLGAQSSADAARAKAQSLAAASATALQMTIQNAIFPALQVRNYIRQTRNMSIIQAQWDTVMPDFARGSPPSSWGVQIAPAGWLNLTWPRPTPEEADTPSYQEFDGLDPDLSPYRDEIILSMMGDGIVVLGPLIGFDGTGALIFQFPVFLPNVSENEMFGTRTPTGCPPGLCYNTTTRTRWWGTVVNILWPDQLLADDSLKPIRAEGYQMQIWSSPSPVSPDPSWTNVNVTDTNSTQPTGDIITADLPVGNRVWRVYIWYDQWEPTWEGPVIGAVVVISVVCSLLVFFMLLSWAEHQVLLESVLPKSAIERMRQDMDWIKPTTHRPDLKIIEIETPAQHMMAIIRSVQAGELPPMSMVVAVQQALEKSADVYRPASQDLKTMLNQANDIDDEVQAALVNQLAGRQVQGSGCSETGLLPCPPEGLDLIKVVTDDEQDHTPATLPATAGAPARKLSLLPAGQEQLTGSKLQRVVNFIQNPDTTAAADTFGNVPSKPLMDQLEAVLHTANTWQFDAYALEEASQGHPLSVLGYWIMQQSGCMEYARMDPVCLARFLRKIECGYKVNAYHNKRHAADVLQSLHAIMHRGGLVPAYVDQLTMLGCYLAAVIHDYEHLGRSNDYLINTTDALAVRYNDKSPMENHHLAAAWEVLLQPEYNCLKALVKSQWEKLRKLVIELVLATDMRQHFAIIGQFTALNNANAKKSNSTGGSDGSPASSARPTVRMSRSTPISESDKLLTLQVALKCSDLGHLAAPLPVHLKWVSGLEEELFLQGDAERAQGLAISPLCDRSKEGVTKSQVGFFEFCVLPLYTNFCGHHTACRPMLDAVVSNYHHWKGKASPVRQSKELKRQMVTAKEEA